MRVVTIVTAQDCKLAATLHHHSHGTRSVSRSGYNFNTAVTKQVTGSAEWGGRVVFHRQALQMDTFPERLVITHIGFFRLRQLFFRHKNVRRILQIAQTAGMIAIKMGEDDRIQIRRADAQSFQLPHGGLMSKAESGKIELHPEPYRPKDFLNYIDAVIGPLCREKNLKLVIGNDQIPGIVPLMDELRTNQILFNLFSNAVKYTPEGGTVTFTLKENLTNDNKLAMSSIG